MNTIIEKIKAFFVKKELIRFQDDAPDEFCPYCWKHDDWDNKYKVMFGDKQLDKGGENLEIFVKQIVDSYQGTVQSHADSNKKTCLTCNKFFGDV